MSIKTLLIAGAATVGLCTVALAQNQNSVTNSINVLAQPNIIRAGNQVPESKPQPR